MKEFFEKNKTIIILIVVAVAAYLLWKRKKDTESVADSSVVVATTAPDKNNLEDVINVAFTDSYKDVYAAKARKIYATNTANMTVQAEYEKKAANKGYTLPQMAVIDGAYIECYKQNSDGTWTKRDDYHEKYFAEVVSRVRGM